MGSSPIHVKVNAIRNIAVRYGKDAYFCDQARCRSSSVFSTRTTLKRSKIVCTVRMSLFPFLSMMIFRAMSFSNRCFVKTRWVPLLIWVPFHRAPRWIQVTCNKRSIIHFRPIVSVVNPRLRGLERIFIPCVRVSNCNSLARAWLIGNCDDIVRRFRPSSCASNRAFRSTCISAYNAGFTGMRSRSSSGFTCRHGVIWTTMGTFRAVKRYVGRTAKWLIVEFSNVYRNEDNRYSFRAAWCVVRLFCPLRSILFFKRDRVGNGPWVRFLRELCEFI